MAGRKPLPTQLKILRGTARKDRLNNEPKGKLTVTGAPYWLKDKKAKHAWKELEKMLGPIGVLTDLDRMALEPLVITYSQWREACDKASIEVEYTENGYPIPNPYLQIQMKLQEKLLKLLVEFGLTPSSRSRINLPEEPEEENPLEKMLKGAG